MRVLFTVQTRCTTPQTIARLVAVTNGKTVYIQDIFVISQHRRRGIATYAMFAIFEAFPNHTWVELDDCTGDSFTGPNNIYTKVGFRYKNRGYPEMVSRLSYARTQCLKNHVHISQDQSNLRFKLEKIE